MVLLDCHHLGSLGGTCSLSLVSVSWTSLRQRGHVSALLLQRSMQSAQNWSCRQGSRATPRGRRSRQMQQSTEGREASRSRSSRRKEQGPSRARMGGEDDREAWQPPKRELRKPTMSSGLTMRAMTERRGRSRLHSDEDFKAK